MTGAAARLTGERRAHALHDAARYIRKLEADVLAEQERADRMRDGYARLMEQAAEVVGEAVRITAKGE